jgi:hypothetical protein
LLTSDSVLFGASRTQERLRASKVRRPARRGSRTNTRQQPIDPAKMGACRGRNNVTNKKRFGIPRSAIITPNQASKRTMRACRRQGILYILDIVFGDLALQVN